MKKILLSLVTMLALTGLVQAQQQFANNSFESWDTIGDYTQPGSWYTLNPLVPFGLPQTVDLTTDAHSGNYAVVLESKDAGGGTVLPGVLATGPLLDAQFNPDFEHLKIPFPDKPTSVKFYYKSWLQPGDSAVFSMTLTRWNVSQQKTDTLADANFFFKDTVDTYTLANLTFDYLSPLPPDSAFIIISSSLDGFNPTAGDKIQIDDIEVVYTTGISEVNKLNLNIYPNPVKDILTIDLAHSTTIAVEIYDQMGRRVMQAVKTGNDRNLNVSSLNSGIYFMMLRNESGAMQQTKLIIED
jgi:hypothetical protein